MGTSASKASSVATSGIPSTSDPKDNGAFHYDSPSKITPSDGCFPSDHEVVFMTGALKNGISPSSPTETSSTTDETSSLVSSLSASENDFGPSFRVKLWDRKQRFSDLIQDGLRAMKKETSNVIMLFESPSSAPDSPFCNTQVYKFHEYPPTLTYYKKTLGPCRYASMNGSAVPVYLHSGTPPEGLVEHWEAAIPGFIAPRFVSDVPKSAHVYAYLPVETITHHVNDPHVHYHLAGKDAIPLMTEKTTKLLPNTSHSRPCIAKTTHSMASKGIFIIRDDQDEKVFKDFLAETGNPSFIVTELVDIERNAACHFFVHPNGDITWFGSNENWKDENGRWSMDSYLIMKDQEYLREIQLPFVKDVAKYCHSLGFWGCMGIDVLFDKSGKGYMVDLNPRVTGSCPSLMVAQLLQEKYGFDYGLFRRNGAIYYYGSCAQLLAEVETFNKENEGKCHIVLFGISPTEDDITSVNIGVYSHSLEECKEVLNRFAQPKRD